jgi:hypothetical protein
MPKFYFNYHGRVTVADEDGEELPSRVDAEQRARLLAEELARNKPPGARRGGEIVVTDETGIEVFRISLDD